MKINVCYFASLREELGRGEDVLSLDNTQVSAAKVWAMATDNLALPEKILVAINQEYVDLDAQVHDGDEVAFFPPVTGG